MKSWAFTFMLVFFWQSFVFSQSCEDKVADLAELHLAIVQDPPSFIKAVLNEQTGGAVAGGGLGLGVALSLTPQKVKQWRRQRNLNRKLLKQNLNEIRKVMMLSGDPLYRKYHMGHFVQFYRPKPPKKINDRINFQGSLREARIAVDNMLKSENMKVSSAVREKMINTVADTYKKMDIIRKQNKGIQSQMTNLHRKRVMASKSLMGIGGASLGILAGDYAKAAMLKKACKPFGVDKWSPYFVTSLGSIATENNPCYLSMDGASRLANDRSTRQTLCKENPGILAALENSFDLMTENTIKKVKYKPEMLENIEVGCQYSTKNPNYSVRVGNTSVKISHDHTGAHYTFDMKGSQAGPNGGTLEYTAQGPSFKNSLGSRLSRQSEDKEDYQTLVDYYLQTPEAPTLNPVLTRRYLTGAALMFSSLYRDDYLKKCQSLEPERLVELQSTD